MKTIIDAVNELKGDLNNVHNNVGDRKCLYSEVGTSDYIVLYDEDATDECFYLISTTTEFNNLVTELSNWQPTLPKVETVEYKGMVYEIGKIYEFRDNDKGWYADVLVAVENGTSFPFESVSTVNKFCRECQSTLGTITPAPTKLIDNNIYTFELNCDLWSGFYRESRGSFFTQLVGGNKICSASEASQITHLTAAK